MGEVSRVLSTLGIAAAAAIGLSVLFNELDDTVRIEGEINAQTESDFIRDFNQAARGASEDNPVIISIDSHGGEANAGFNIMEYIESSGVPVVMRCDGAAYSMAAILLIGTNSQSREANPGCTILIHEPYLDTGDMIIDRDLLAATVQSLRDDIDTADYTLLTHTYLMYQLYILERMLSSLEELRDDTIDRLTWNTDLTREDLEIMYQYGDVIFMPRQAGALGLVDKVYGRSFDEQDSQRIKSQSCPIFPAGMSFCPDR